MANFLQLQTGAPQVGTSRPTSYRAAKDEGRGALGTLDALVSAENLLPFAYTGVVQRLLCVVKPRGFEVTTRACSILRHFLGCVAQGLEDRRGYLGQQLHGFVEVVHDPDGPAKLRRIDSGADLLFDPVRHVRPTRICARSSNKNLQHQHSKSVRVKWSFSRRHGSNVSHTRQGVVNVPQGLI
jgi:hypothetical protein